MTTDHATRLLAPVKDASRRQGALLDERGCHFGLWAPRAERVELVLVDESGGQTSVDLTPPGAHDDGIWTTHRADIAAGQRYGFRLHGPWRPDQGLRLNPAKVILDPYARAITGQLTLTGPVRDHTGDLVTPNTGDNLGFVPLSVVVAEVDPPRPIQRRARLDHPTQRVLMETHLAGFTRTHPDIPDDLRGSYAGMAHPAAIAHLQRLGVTTVQLLPMHHFVSEAFLLEAGRTNYWGYNTVGFFAPHAGYSSSGSRGQQVTEFRDLVDTLHAAGIEVFLDVVYNHTAEGGLTSPTLSLRGIDQAGYYRLADDGATHLDFTGCGNSLDTSQPQVQRLVLDSLRHWVTQFGIDGFRFDLATTLIRGSDHQVDLEHPLKKAIETDPVLSQVTLISEPWDIGPNGYQVGSWGSPWSEWNDRFRDDLRDFWRGAGTSVATLATRLAGSSDLFDHHRGTAATVNFITAHDGFTLRDLVSYDHKHNEANGEHNRDGVDFNRSCNHGVEGETDDESIKALRRRQVKNLMATQLLAAGVPMLTAGDELGRTQQGNNNAYCQDNPLSWHDWTLLDGSWAEVTRFTEDLITLRFSHPVLCRPEHGHGQEILTRDGTPTGRVDLAWFGGHGEVMTAADWNEPHRRHLGMFLSLAEQALLVWFNGGDHPVEVLLPQQPWANRYQLLLSSADELELPTGHDDEFASGTVLQLPARSVTVLAADSIHL